MSQLSSRKPAENIHELNKKITLLEDRLRLLENKTSLMSPYPEQLNMQKITLVVAKHYQLAVTELLSHNRTKTYRNPRNIAIYLCYQLLDYPMTDIARHFMRDPGTIRHAIRTIEHAKKQQKMLAYSLQILQQKLSANHTK